MITNKNAVSIASLTLTLSFVFLGIFFNEWLNRMFTTFLKVTVDYFGWFYLTACSLFLLVCVYLMFSKYGSIKLGEDTDQPEYSTASWIAMLFSAAMGCGLVFWGVSEPVLHYITPPFGKGSTPEAADLSMKFVFFHWGFNAWAIYAIVALGLAYFQFRKKLPGLISSIFYPILKDGIYGPIGKTIDIYSVFVTALGFSTVLGVTTLQLAGGLTALWGIPNTLSTQLVIIAVVTVLFLISATSGIDRGVKYLSNFNMILSVALMLLLLFIGPTTKIINIFINTTGTYLNDLIGMNLRIETFREDTWISSWTIFYWAWWATWAPYAGTFIARISKGRTIKEFLIGALLVPAFITFLWFAVFGGSALHLITDLKQTALVDIINKDMTLALFAFLDYFPFSSILSFLAIVLIANFFISSADSATYVLAMYGRNGNLNPPNKDKIIWGLIIAASAVVLLMSGGLDSVQTVSIAIAFPFYILMVIMCYTILKAVKDEKINNTIDEREKNGKGIITHKPQMPKSRVK